MRRFVHGQSTGSSPEMPAFMPENVDLGRLSHSRNCRELTGGRPGWAQILRLPQRAAWNDGHFPQTLSFRYKSVYLLLHLDFHRKADICPQMSRPKPGPSAFFLPISDPELNTHNETRKEKPECCKNLTERRVPLPTPSRVDFGSLEISTHSS